MSLMKWIVLEENPKPDEYIAVIMVTDKHQRLQLQGKASSTFLNGEDAMNRARELRDFFGVKMIRVFHWESHSSPA